jgi:hypothetical protein
MKMAVLLDMICRVNVVAVKTPMTFFIDIEKNPKIPMEAQKILNNQNKSEQKEKC